jgi:ABC-type transporter Mla subunit MlaD
MSDTDSEYTIDALVTYEPPTPEALAARQAQFTQAVEEVAARLETLQAQRDEARALVRACAEGLATVEAERDALRQERDTLRRALGLAPLVALDSGDVRRDQGGRA